MSCELENRFEDDDDVVLTGLSGRFPESDNIEEFAQHLFDGDDLVTSDGRRWTPGLYGLPERCGKLKNLSHFDATYFGVHAKLANMMDPQQRLVLETTHEAIIDAGYSPAEFRGSRTGVYVGACFSETEPMLSSDVDQITGYELIGCNSAMFANRISYTYDLTGPSLSVNTACSSSLTALAQAYAAIVEDKCDAAIVAGCNLCLKPTTSLEYHRLGVLSPEGRCAAFDAEANGFVRSEGIVSVVLQRRKIARRVYATVCCARVNNDGLKEQGITFPSGDMQRRLAEETFAEACLRPQDVSYFEAHGTGTKVGDPQEVNAIAELFCTSRPHDSPLLLGSVKSNMGHAEAAAGLCSVVKVILAMERGIIPANIHYHSPNPDIPALHDGRIKVVSESTPWDGGLVAINSFGFGGANAHVILKSERTKKPSPTRSTVPRLVVASGGTEEAVCSLLQQAEAHPSDAELHALLDAVHAYNIPGHTHRGFKLLTDSSVVEKPQLEVFEVESGKSRPVWFIFAGMGSHSPGIGLTLMVIPEFAESIKRSAAVLKPLGVDLVHLITEAPEATFENAIASFVSITAVQVALVDVLGKLGVRLDGIVGFSVGEIGCAYADGALSATQAILASYWCGKSVVDAQLPPGLMASIELSWEECAARCPADVEITCNMAVKSVSIGGPLQSVKKFVDELSEEGILTRIMKSSGIAFHSTYMAVAAPLLLGQLMTVISEPKLRSSSWISSSLPKDQSNCDIGRFCDANYFVNNMLSPVWFVEALQQVPLNAVVIELAPHANLHQCLKRALPIPDAVHVPLLRREATCPLTHLLRAVGRLFGEGLHPQIAQLYPRLQWPVSRGTPSLASRVRWDHSIEWNVASYDTSPRSSEHKFEFDLNRTNDAFIAGHNIDGRILFPATGFLMIVWQTIAKLYNKKTEETAVILENVDIRRTTVVSHKSPLQFFVNVLGTGEFDVCEGNVVVVTGTVRLASETAKERASLPETENSGPGQIILNNDDIYKELRMSGFNYSGVFRGITSSNEICNTGYLKWDGNWVSFIDNMLQYRVFATFKHDLCLVTRIQRALIDPYAQPAPGADVAVRYDHNSDVVAAGAIELRGCKFSVAPRNASMQMPPKLECYSFIPYTNIELVENTDAIHVRLEAISISLQIVLENMGVFQLKLCEVAFESEAEKRLLPLVLSSIDGQPQIHVEATFIAACKSHQYQALQELEVKVINHDVRTSALNENYHVVLSANILAQHDVSTLQHLVAALSPGGMLLLEEPLQIFEENAARETISRAGLRLVSRQPAVTCEYLLLRLAPVLPSAKPFVIDVTDDAEFSWVTQLREVLAHSLSKDMRIYIVSRATDSGILGLSTCLRAEPGGRAIHTFYLPNAEKEFMPDVDAYAPQVALDLAVNVLYSGIWGSYRHLGLGENQNMRKPVEIAYVNIERQGDLSSLQWIQSELTFLRTEPDTELCFVHYAALNFRDVMLATGKLPVNALPENLVGKECVLGLEFSGQTSSGRRVMGMVPAKGLATSVLVDRDLLCEVPESWSLEEAATVPIAYATAYYALEVRGQMQPGESVLVHAGSGGVGQAAISIALHKGCTVFTTAGTAAKRAFLCQRFPQLKFENVGNSRDCSFEDLVMRKTRGRGVDLVLNSLAGDKLRASLRCLAVGGRFLEIGKVDFFDNSPLGMTFFLKNTSFHGILLDALFETNTDQMVKVKVVRCISEGISSGAVRPLPTTVFSHQQLETAFRFMASSKHIGKVLLRVFEDEIKGSMTAIRRSIIAVPRISMYPGKSYVLVGGLGGFGLELAHWLVKRGATRLLLCSRGGVRTGYQAQCLRYWRLAGVTVRVLATDVALPGAAHDLLLEAAKLGPVGGVFNLAAVLHDAYFDKQTPDSFKFTARPKIYATRMLDEATRFLAPELDYFVVFSSVTCGRGNPGQSNYGFANSAMERIVERRRVDGLPGVAVQWGAIGEVGMVIDTMDEDCAEVGGTVPQRIASCLKALDTLLTQPHAVTASMVVAEKRRSSIAPSKNFVHSIANIFGIRDIKKVSEMATFSELGMDSLMSAEIKQILEPYNLSFTVSEIRALTFGKLCELSAVKGSISNL